MDKLKFVEEPVKTSSTSSSGTTGSAAGGSMSRPATSTSTSSSSKSKWYPDHAVMSGATKESLKSTPEFKFD
jgi:hypothetical protein